MISSLRRQKNFLNEMFFKKFNLMRSYDELANTKPITEADREHYETRKDQLQIRINDADLCIQKFMENTYGG